MATKKNNAQLKRIKKFFESSSAWIYIFSTTGSFLLIFIFMWIMDIVDINLSELNLYVMVLIVFGYSIIIGTLISKVISKRNTQDSREILTALQRVASGDFSFKLDSPKNNIFKDIYDNINLMIDELNSIQLMKKDFVSNFSHEFKTPLSSIKGYAEYLLQSTNLNKSQRSYINIIISESERLAGLTTNISLINKIDNMKLDPNVNEFSIDKQIREIIISLHPIFNDKQIKIDIDLPSIKYSANEMLFRNVFSNIISNAIKYSKENSLIKIYSNNTEHQQQIIVEDQGIGMDEQTLNHIFEKFYQGNQIESESGLGLGLTICKKIVEHYNGKIEIESKLNKGTKVIVTL